MLEVRSLVAAIAKAFADLGEHRSNAAADRHRRVQVISFSSKKKVCIIYLIEIPILLIVILRGYDTSS